VVATVRERLAISKSSLNFDMEVFDLRKLYELKVRKQCHMISNRFAALENLK
jgi:hypothetical protein